MSHEWMNNNLSDDSLFEEDSLSSVYCPYTNGAQCALVTKGWQPQEVCQALECSQLKLLNNTSQNIAES